MPTKTELDCLTATGRRMARLIAEQEGSGLRIGEFARSRGIPPARFSWWRCEIRRRLERSRLPRGVTQFAEAVVVAPSSFDDQPGVGLVVELGPGRRVEIPVGFDAQTLRRLLGVLSSC